MKSMGSAESTMSAFAKRLKNGRSWCDKGLNALIHFMVGLKDGLNIKTLTGKMTNRLDHCPTGKPSTYYREKLTSTIGEATRQNVAYLQQSSGKPVYDALKAMQGY